MKCTRPKEQLHKHQRLYQTRNCLRVHNVRTTFPTSPCASDLQQPMMERDLQLGQSLRGVFALLDLEVLGRDRIPASAVSRQLMHQLVLTRQSQTQTRLTPVRETQLPPSAGSALRTARPARFGSEREELLSQQAVEELVSGRAVLSQDENVGGAADNVL